MITESEIRQIGVKTLGLEGDGGDLLSVRMEEDELKVDFRITDTIEIGFSLKLDEADKRLSAEDFERRYLRHILGLLI